MRLNVLPELCRALKFISSLTMSNGDVSVEESEINFINNDNEDSVDKKEDADKEVQAIFPGFGIICAILSAALYSCNAALVKMVDLPSVHLSFSRCCVQFLILLPIIQGKHKTVDILGPVGLKSILWIRGFVGSSGMMLLYFPLFGRSAIRTHTQCLGFALTTIALRTERAGVVSILGSIQIIFVYILQVALLGDIPSTLSIVGASLILYCFQNIFDKHIYLKHLIKGWHKFVAFVRSWSISRSKDIFITRIGFLVDLKIIF